MEQPILKRRVAVLRTLCRPVDAISALADFLEAFPTDGEAWSELASLYQSQGMGSQAIFCLEESLLIAPNSWNVRVHIQLLGEYMLTKLLGRCMLAWGSCYTPVHPQRPRIPSASFRKNH